MKGSKKYIGHEYAQAASDAMPNLSKIREQAKASRKDSKTFPKQYADGGNVSPSDNYGSSLSNVAQSSQPLAGDQPNAASAFSSAFKAKGGEVKGVHDKENIKSLNKSLNRFFSEEAQEKTKGGKIEAKNKEEKAEVKGDSKKNDKIPIIASEDEVVLPRSVTKSKDAPEKAEKYMKKLKKDKK